MEEEKTTARWVPLRLSRRRRCCLESRFLQETAPAPVCVPVGRPFDTTSSVSTSRSVPASWHRTWPLLTAADTHAAATGKAPSDDRARQEQM